MPSSKLKKKALFGWGKKKKKSNNQGSLLFMVLQYLKLIINQPVKQDFSDMCISQSLEELVVVK